MGNQETVDFLEAQNLGTTYRVTHKDDLVPQLPFEDVTSYRHTFPEYWVASDNNDQVTAGNVSIIPNKANEDQGNAGTDSGSSLLATFALPFGAALAAVKLDDLLDTQSWYFGPISACD